MSGWLTVRVTEKRAEAQDIASFVLAPLGDPLPPYNPGAHVDVRLPNGLVRQYSLCTAPDRHGHYEIGVLREAGGRGGSRSMHEDIHPGSELEISPPRNLFPLAPQDRALLFAGGIGITPILAMAEHLARAGTPFAMHYCTRSADRAAFRARIESSAFAQAVAFHFDDQPATRMDTAALLGQPEAGTHLYVCGPDGFMDHVLATARGCGWPDSQLHFERFSAPVAAPGSDTAFAIEVEGSDRVIAVAAGQSALQALSDAGFDIPVSCEQGICGTCLTPVTQGIPDHRDLFLSPSEQAANDCFTPCCSRALTQRLRVRI